MSERLPERVDPLRLARQGAILEGVLPLPPMHRLAEYLSSSSGDAKVELAFGLGEGAIGFLRGRAQAQLAVTCQRCLEPMPLEVDTRFAFGLVASEAAAERLGEGYEPLLVGDEPLRLSDLVEDELILALPIVALHDKQDCPAAERLEAAAPESEVQQDADSNPFAVLEQLKRRN